MNTRTTLLLILAALALAFFLFWMRTGGRGVEPTPGSAPSPGLEEPPPPSQGTGPVRSPARTKSGYRLAGTVVGDASYAVVEQPDGTNDLYRPGQTVPGLGRLIELEANRATFEGSDGRYELELVPASTPTVTPLPAEEPTPAATTQPEEPSDLDRTPPATSPSSETDRSAS
jgi:hypothetical protein